MPNLSYDDQQFNMIEREYLKPADCLTQTTYCARWYPKGPILVKKVGLAVTEALTGSSFEVTFNTPAGSVIATINASTTLAIGIASKAATTSTQKEVADGSYISVVANGTADSGSVVPFIDYVRVYDSNHAV